MTPGSMQWKNFKPHKNKKTVFGVEYLSKEGDGWDNMLHDLARASSKGPILVVLDEISWMVSKDPTFLGTMKEQVIE